MYFSTTIIGDLIGYASEKGVPVTDQAWTSDLERKRFVGYDTMVKALNFLRQTLNDEYLGLHIGEQISLQATATVDRIMQHSPTLDESITNAIQYSRVISDALECSSEKTPQQYSIIYDENPNWKLQQSYARKQILDMAILSNVKALTAYTKYQYHPICVHFSYQKPKNLNEYYRLFNCTLKFNKLRSEVIYDRRIIDRHGKNVEFGLLQNLKEKVAHEIQVLPTENDLIYRLKRSILNHMPNRKSADEVAKELVMSRRTLQRKLKDLQTTFKKVESALLLKLAMTYLEENEKTLDEISYLLGFSECSAFIRFFRSLRAQTPTKYKNSTLAR